MKKRRAKKSGFGSVPAEHRSRANMHLYKATTELEKAMNASSCMPRTNYAIEAFGHAIAADVELQGAGDAPLAERIALQAATIINSCIPREAAAPVGKRRFRLIRGGLARR
jgi:hypothetical protein